MMIACRSCSEHTAGTHTVRCSAPKRSRTIQMDPNTRPCWDRVHHQQIRSSLTATVRNLGSQCPMEGLMVLLLLLLQPMLPVVLLVLMLLVPTLVV